MLPLRPVEYLIALLGFVDMKRSHMPVAVAYSTFWSEGTVFGGMAGQRDTAETDVVLSQYGLLLSSRQTLRGWGLSCRKHHLLGSLIPPEGFQ